MHAVSQAISLARATWQSRGLPCAGQLACVPDNREGYHSLASSLAKLMRKLTRKSIPNRSRELPGAAPEHPKSTQNRSRDSLGTPRGAQEHSEGIPEASWKHLGAPPARFGIAQGIPKSGPGRQEERPGAPGSAPGPPKSTPSRARERKNRFLPARLVCEVSSQRCSVDFCTFSFFCKVCKVSKVPRLSAKSRVRPFAPRVTSLAQCCLGKRRKSIQNRAEIVENRVSGPPGRPCRSTFAARGDSVERFRRLLSLEVSPSSDSRRPSRSKWVARAPRSRAQVRARSGSP